MSPMLRKIPRCEHGLMTAEALAVLERICKARSPVRALEIGSFLGCGSTVVIARHSQTLICVDNCVVDFSKRDGILRSESHLHLLLNNLSRLSNVAPLRATSLEASAMIEGGFDFIFIDAGHSEKDVTADIEAWLPKLMPGGIICGDDFCDKFPGVIRAVENAFPKFTQENRIWWHQIP